MTSTAGAQTFPGPGEGSYTWERVGDLPIDAMGLDWPEGGPLIAGGTPGRFGVLTGDGPQGTWRVTEGIRRDLDVVVTLSDGVMLGSSGVVFRSTDGGLTWTPTCDVVTGECNGPRQAGRFLELPPGHPNAGRVLGGGHHYSDDRGLTWTEAPYDGPTNEALIITNFALLPSGRILAAGAGWGFLSSDDGGASWQTTPVYGPYRYAGYGIAPLATPGSVQSGSPSCGLADVSLCEGAVAIGTDAQDAFSRVWLTNDGGRSWRQTQPLEQVYDGVGWGYVGGLFDRGADGATGLGRAVAVLGRGFVFATRDGGETWATVARAPVMGEDSDGKVVNSAVVGPDGRLYAAVVLNSPGREWLYRTVEPMDAAFAVAEEGGPVETPGALGVRVRPNPARGRAEVVLTLAAAGTARVSVFDALGREVAVVLDGEASGGEHVVGLDTSGWPSGIYVVRVEADRRVASVRLVVAR